MSTDNPEDWVDLVGLGVLAFAGVASSVLPTWFMKRKGKGGAEKDTNVSDDKDKVLNGLAEGRIWTICWRRSLSYEGRLLITSASLLWLTVLW